MSITYPCVVPAVASVPIAFINSAQARTTSAGSGATTTGFDSTGGNLAIIWVSYSAAPTVSDNMGNTYTNIPAATFAGARPGGMYYCASPTVGAGHTFTMASGTAVGCIFGAVFSGAAASPLDQSQNGAFASVGTGNTGSTLTPGFAGELIIAGTGFGHLAETDVSSIDSSFIGFLHQKQVAGQTQAGAFAYLIETAIVGVDPTWTFNDAVTSGGCALASFKAA